MSGETDLFLQNVKSFLLKMQGNQANNVFSCHLVTTLITERVASRAV